MPKVKMPKGKIGPQLTNKVVPWVEQFWHAHKRYPTDTELSTEFGFSAFDLERLHASKFYKICLDSRGIRMREGNLSEKQIAAITVVSNIHDTRPNAAKLAGIGVTSEEYYGWQQDPKFKAELEARAEDLLGNLYPEAVQALGKQVKGGNINALKFYWEVSGRMDTPELVNVKMMMQRVIEAVQKHVKDPEVLAAIGEEIQNAQRASVAVVTPASIESHPSSLRAMHQKHLNQVNGNG